jgi:hypothetical protein
METSSYFERTLFYDRSPAAEEYYARSAQSLFETDPQRSRIEVRIQSSVDASYYERKQERVTPNQPNEDEKAGLEAVVSRGTGPASGKAEAQQSHKDYLSKVDRNQDVDVELKSPASESEYAWSLSSKASSTALSTALDQHRGSSPPSYPGPPKLTVVDLDTETVQSFVKRTRTDFRVFYLRQRHSYSRLQITKELFEQLLRACHVFPRFNEYLIGFGLKTSDSEVGPPPLKFRPLCTSHNISYHGFGACVC